MEKKRTLYNIEKEIAETKRELENVQGTPCEVYARIVGYYRSVKNWNKGKRHEYELRKMFIEPKTAPTSQPKKDLAPAAFEIFTRKTCPKCPQVKEYVNSLSMNGIFVDTDTEEGLKTAAAKGVMSTPTVIFYNEAGGEIARCHSVEEIKLIA